MHNLLTQQNNREDRLRIKNTELSMYAFKYYCTMRSTFASSKGWLHEPLLGMQPIAMHTVELGSLAIYYMWYSNSLTSLDSSMCAQATSLPHSAILLQTIHLKLLSVCSSMSTTCTTCATYIVRGQAHPAYYIIIITL